MDRYHQYSPHQPRNALTFIQKGDADSLFRKFLIDNIKEAECCPYIPDTELLRFDLANMRQVPPVDTHTPFEEYISKELLPYFQEHCIPLPNAFPCVMRSIPINTRMNRTAAY